MSHHFNQGTPHKFRRKVGGVAIQPNTHLLPLRSIIYDLKIYHVYFQAHCKSYGKVKKVAFRQPSNSDSDSQSTTNIAPAKASSDEEDDLKDLNFEMPVVEEKKPRKKKSKKQKMTKKEVRCCYVNS